MSPLTMTWELILVRLGSILRVVRYECVWMMMEWTPLECGVGQIQCASVSGMECGYSIVKCTYFSTGICSDLPSLTNGMISYSGDVAIYTCDTGYTLTEGSSFRFFTSGGWEGSAPTYQGKLCN